MVLPEESRYIKTILPLGDGSSRLRRFALFFHHRIRSIMMPCAISYNVRAEYSKQNISKKCLSTTYIKKVCARFNIK